MAASPSSRAGMVRLASFERCQEKPCVGKFHYEKVGSTVSPGPGRFLCTQLRIAVSAHADGHSEVVMVRELPPTQVATAESTVA